MPEDTKNSPPCNGVVKELYMAKSLAQLQSMSSVPIDPKIKLEMAVKGIEKVITEADKLYQLNDEERSYVLYRRGLENYLNLKKRPNVDLKYVDLMLPASKFKKIMDKLEILDKNLTRRYDILNAVKSDEENKKIPNGHLINKSEEEKKEVLPDLVTNNVITCIELYKFIQSLAKDPPGINERPALLILDVRSKDEFSQSKIANLKLPPAVCEIVNIPRECVTAQNFLKKIEPCLEKNAIDQLKKRRIAKKIVILDHDSLDKESASPEVTNLYDALWRWDGSQTDRISRPPYVLKAGYLEWLLTYPTLTTNSNYVRHKEKPKSELTKVNYDFDDEEPMKKPLEPLAPKTNLPNGINGDQPDVVVTTWNKKTPGGAKPVIIPDRSTKPKPSPVEENKKVDAIDNQVKTLKLEDTEDKVAPIQRRSSPTVPVTIDRGNFAVGGDDNESDEEMPELRNTIHRPSERPYTLSESAPKDLPRFMPSSGLSRSYSSPNIAQLDDATSAVSERRASVATPRFDRSLKPSSQSAFKTTKIRNFAPVYGSLNRVSGLKNLGNTCFMNSVIQCLSSTIDLGLYLLSDYRKDINRGSKFGSNGDLAEELAELIRLMWSGQYKSLSPKDLKEAVSRHLPGFVGCEQQDAHEFLTMLLEKVHSDLNRSIENGPITIDENLDTHLAIKKFWSSHMMKNKSKISEIFEGLLLSTLECTVCQKRSNSFETFTCLSLPIPNGHRPHLLDCLKLFSEQEKMFGEAAWDCPTCKVKRDAVKRIQVCRLPKVLVIHLKRFSFEGLWRHKLTTAVEYPLTKLDMKNYIHPNHGSPTTNYDLYGVVNHTGTMEGGHYVALCKNPDNSTWFKFDDHEVSEINQVDVKSNPAAYVLFYTMSS